MRNNFKYIQWCAVIWLSLSSLAFMLTLFGAHVAVDAGLWRHVMLSLADGALLTLPMVWPGRWWRRGVWIVLPVITCFVAVNVLYSRNFASLMPYTTMFWWGNVNSMVVGSAIASLRWSDLWLAAPLAFSMAAWFGYFRHRTAGGGLAAGSATSVTVCAVLFWTMAQALGSASYISEHENTSTDSSNSPSGVIRRKLSGEGLTRQSYLANNGFVAYTLWNLRDFSPAHTLNADDKDRIERFVRATANAENALPLPERADSLRRNLLIIMVESLESWPLDMVVDGRPAMPMVDSLLSLEQTLYWPHVVPQISLGTSSDGHLMTVAGLLPLRDYAAASEFGGNRFRTLFHAFKDLGYSTFEIISDDPAMWNQSTTSRSYGFDNFYWLDHIDPSRKSAWAQRDSYLAMFAANYLPECEQPFAGMIVTLSLHSPYRGKKSGEKRFDNAGLPQQSANYLKMACFDDKYIAKIVHALQNSGRFNNTTIVITGDHNAFGLTEANRCRQALGTPYIPFIVVNSGFPRHRHEDIAGQIDIYPTLLDICRLDNHCWRGVGRSMLRGAHGATTRTGAYVGNPDSCPADERRRQKEAWEVSRLIITSDALK